MRYRADFSVNISCLGFAFLLSLASCRKYVFPMCPPNEWSVPGGMVRSDGTVNYHLVCEYGYTTPLMHNDVDGHPCVEGKPSKLPRRCVRKIYAYETIQYGISIENSAVSGKDACSDKTLQSRIKRMRFFHIRLGRGHLFQVNSHLTAYKLRLNVNSCLKDSGIYYLRIFIRNVPKANGTKKEIKKFHNFVISETFLSIKKEVLKKMREHYNLADPKPSGLKRFRNDSSIPILNQTSTAQERTKRDTPEHLDSLQQAYLGLFEAKTNPADYECPKHLILKKINTTEGHEVLCVGCGKGWLLVKQRYGYKCYPCGPGFYSETDTATTCQPCPVKYQTSPWDATNINDCFQVGLSLRIAKKWTLTSCLIPLGSTALLTIAISYLSKKILGRSSYRAASQRKGAKFGTKAISEQSTPTARSALGQESDHLT